MFLLSNSLKIFIMEKNENKKVLGKLKLNKLTENMLERREMKVLKGGCGCAEACSPATNISTTGVFEYAPM